MTSLCLPVNVCSYSQNLPVWNSLPPVPWINSYSFSFTPEPIKKSDLIRELNLWIYSALNESSGICLPPYIGKKCSSLILMYSFLILFLFYLSLTISHMIRSLCVLEPIYFSLYIGYTFQNIYNR